MKFNLVAKAKVIILLVVVNIITACSEGEDETITISPAKIRWYTAEQVVSGEKVYRENCIACHLGNAQGTAVWKQRLSDGSYPPPPLNGSAHAWHHSRETLLAVINDGGQPMGGKMPPFRTVLSEDKKQAVISYFQSFWTDEIYQRWVTIDQRN